MFFYDVLRFLSFNESTFHGKSYLKNATSSTISVGCMRSDRCLEDDIWKKSPIFFHPQGCAFQAIFKSVDPATR